MTRKSRVFGPLEALEPKVLLSAVRAVTQLPAGLAPVVAHPLTLTPPGVTTPTGAIAYVVTGSYGHAGRSLPVNATGGFLPLGQVSVKGSITLSGRKTAEQINGVLTLTGSQGSVTIQVKAGNARNVVGHGPVTVTETVIGATGNGTAVQGESGSGDLELGHWVGTIHGNQGEAVTAHGSFLLVISLNPPTG